MCGTSSNSGDVIQPTSTSVNKPIEELAEEKLRELIQQGNLDAIALAKKLSPQVIEVTC